MSQSPYQDRSIIGHFTGNAPAPLAFRRRMSVLLVLAVGLAWVAHARIARMFRRNAIAQIVVCIDPGHPSEYNSGRHHQHGTTELEMNWAVATRLEALLNKDNRFRAFKTRESREITMMNRKRALIANEAKADLAIHLHCDAGPGRGYTIYYPDRAGLTEGQKGPSREIRIASREAALAVHDGMTQGLSGVLHDRGVKGESFTKIGHKFGALTTSVFSEVPTITVEMVFLSNAYDAEFIKSQSGQRRMTEALATGIEQYLRPEQTGHDSHGR